MVVDPLEAQGLGLHMAHMAHMGCMAHKRQGVSGDRSGTDETVSEDAVAPVDVRSPAEEAALARIIDGRNAFHRQHGLLSDEFSTL
jgi:hypothetical protein